MFTSTAAPLAGAIDPVAGTETARAQALGRAVAAARALGLDPAGAVIFREARATLVRLPAAGAVARVERAGNEAGGRAQVAVGAAMMAAGVPVMRLLRPELQPLGDGGVTVWELLEPAGPPLSSWELGALGRRLHDATAGRPAGPPVQLFAQIALLRPRCEGWLSVADASAIDGAIAALQRALPPLAAADPLGSALVHGDLSQANVLRTAAGPVMIDLEEAGWGPRSLDFAPRLLAARHYGLPAEALDAFFQGYGAPPPAPDYAEALVRLRGLVCLLWAGAMRRSSPAIAAEALRRRESFLGREDQRWTVM